MQNQDAANKQSKGGKRSNNRQLAGAQWLMVGCPYNGNMNKTNSGPRYAVTSRVSGGHLNLLRNYGILYGTCGNSKMRLSITPLRIRRLFWRAGSMTKYKNSMQ